MKMGNKNYTTIIEVDKNADDVFNSIIAVPKWWSKDFEGGSTKLNDEFVINHPGQHYSKQKLIEVIPGSKIVWLVTESNLNWLKKDKEEWTNTKIIFEITTEDRKTILRFTHEGLVPRKECYALCEQGWNIVVKDWLFHFITTGKPADGMTKAADIRNRYLEDKTQKENQSFHRVITVNASAEEAMKKISQIDCWWVKDISGDTEKLNDQFHVPMGRTFIDFQITELVPNKKVVWKVTDSCIPWLKDKNEWTSTEVVFEISEKENATQIDFRHIGLVPDIECYKVCEEGWNGHITRSLVNFINTGEGMPKQF